jgi:phosphoserine phosphatase RsbU/P
LDRAGLAIQAAVDPQPDWPGAIVDLLKRARQVKPDDLATEIRAAAAAIGVEVTIYLADLEQKRLWPLPVAGRPTPSSLLIDGTPAGRAFAAVEICPHNEPEGRHRWWVPMVDGSERLGVAEVVAARPPADPAAFVNQAEVMIGLIGHLVTVKYPYGDALQITRRTRPMTPAAELLMAALPPLTFSTHQVVISAVLQPTYDVGGDAFDYAVDGPRARVVVLDAMGRGLTAGLTSAATMAAIRAARRAAGDLPAMARAADRALTDQFADARFVTGLLAELNVEQGVVQYLNAGHPLPILFRDGRAIKTLTGGRRTPLGVRHQDGEVGAEQFHPGDRLLIYTDGVTEAYDRDGARFGTERLTDLAESCMADRLPPPETLRRLAYTVIEHQGGTPSDDATLMLLEWSAEAAARTQP